MEAEKVFSEGKEIILIGTAHISEKSIENVRQTIEKERPDIVGVELDSRRYIQLKSGKRWRETNIGEVIRKGNTYLFLINIMLANLQRQLGQKIGITPGEEMMTAIRIAEEKKIPVVLLDRDVRITLKRALNQMNIIEKAKLFYSILAGFFGNEKENITKEVVEKLKQKDVMSGLMQELSSEMPSIKKVLVDERDVYIANKILSAEGKKVVAVVGAGHVDGVKKYLDRKRDIAQLLTVKRKTSYWGYLKFLVPAIFFALIAYSLLTKQIMTSITILMLWFLINGTLSALGVVFARGHPYSITAAFLAAPFTSLHPFLAAGWFAAAVEAKVKNPKVKDFENLRNLNTYKDFTENQATKILLVAAYANVGSTLGTFIALPYIVSLLA